MINSKIGKPSTALYRKDSPDSSRTGNQPYKKRSRTRSPIDVSRNAVTIKGHRKLVYELSNGKKKRLRRIIVMTQTKFHMTPFPDRAKDLYEASIIREFKLSGFSEEEMDEHDLEIINNFLSLSKDAQDEKYAQLSKVLYPG